MIIIVMGVCGCGKTTVGTALADRLRARFIEGDDLHPPENRTKMASGQPLTDDDRWPWLDAIAREIGRCCLNGSNAVVSCSALKRTYRDRLRHGDPDATFIYLTGSPETLRARLDARRDHFMPPGLLESQFAALEPPDSDEHVLTVDVSDDPDSLVATILPAVTKV